jgi:hypothetical protein
MFSTSCGSSIGDKLGTKSSHDMEQSSLFIFFFEMYLYNDVGEKKGKKDLPK